MATTQLDAIRSEHELFRYVMRSFHGFQKATYMKMMEKHAEGRVTSCGAEPPPAGEGTGDQPQQGDAQQIEEVADVMASIWVQGNVVQFGHLEEAVER